jgi:acetamidase/formamidase
MTIGFSPFLTADVDETTSHTAQWSPAIGGSEGGDVLSVRLELIRRRVAAGYYSSTAMATELARRLAQRESFEDC